MMENTIDIEREDEPGSDPVSEVNVKSDKGMRFELKSLGKAIAVLETVTGILIASTNSVRVGTEEKKAEAENANASPDSEVEPSPGRSKSVVAMDIYAARVKVRRLTRIIKQCADDIDF